MKSSLILRQNQNGNEKCAWCGVVYHHYFVTYFSGEVTTEQGIWTSSHISEGDVATV